MGGVVVGKIDVEAFKIGGMTCPCFLDEGFGGDAAFGGVDLDGGAVGVVGAHVEGFVSHHAHGSRKHVGLYRFDHVAQMDGSVGIG